MTKYRVNKSTRITTKDHCKLCTFLPHCLREMTKVEDIDTRDGESANNGLDELVKRAETLLGTVDIVLCWVFFCIYVVALLAVVVIGLLNN